MSIYNAYTQPFHTKYSFFKIFKLFYRFEHLKHDYSVNKLPYGIQ